MVLLGLGIVAVTGIVAPFLDGSRFNGQIQRTLEASLGRKVSFESVHFTFFSGPGFSLENVTISDDGRYGLEPFASVPTLQAHVRLDKLLLGEIQFSSLRLVEPLLNFVKCDDGAWNVVELVERLSAPRRMPLNFFPVFEVSGGRVNFKLGIRKSTLYLLNSDLSVYPERSGKLFIQFSGWPARTDRAGIGFGHLRGKVNWYVNPKSAEANQMEADLTLDPSNLSEIMTLIEGHDIGVHGTVSSHATIEGPLAGLRVRGELRLEDVHRWDLLPSSGEDLQVQYGGRADLLLNNLVLHTFGTQKGEETPVTLEMTIEDFLTNPRCSLDAHLTKIPIGNVLPLGRRMGWVVPPDLSLTGTLGGVIRYRTGEGLHGNVEIQNVAATLPGVPPLSVARAGAAVTDDRVHFDPTEVQADTGRLRIGGDFYLSMPRAQILINAEEYPTEQFKRVVRAWFGTPEILNLLKDGLLSAQVFYNKNENENPLWSGRAQFSQATLNLPGLSVPLQRVEGRAKFNASELELTQLRAVIGSRLLRGSYRYNADARRPEHLRLEMPAVSLGEIQNFLAPTLEAQGWLARLHMAKRRAPGWLKARNMEGELDVAHLSVGDTVLGPLTAHFIWQGTEVQFPSLRLRLPAGALQAEGGASLISYSPRYTFTANVDGYRWRGGVVSAKGTLEAAGTDLLRNLRAEGTFSGSNLSLSSDDTFNQVTGEFAFSFADGWPRLQLLKVQAADDENAWTGEAISQSDGKLIFDLEHAGQQRKIVSTITSEPSMDTLLLQH